MCKGKLEPIMHFNWKKKCQKTLFCFLRAAHAFSVSYFPLCGCSVPCDKANVREQDCTNSSLLRKDVWTLRVDTELWVFWADLYSAWVCSLRVTDWQQEPSIDCSEDVIEAGVMGSRTWTLSLWHVQLSYKGYNQGTSSSCSLHAEMHQAHSFRIMPVP